MDDLEAAISRAELGVSSIPEDDVKIAERLSNLAVML